MIKLEDLKIGDKIYGVTSDGLGLFSESIVEKELFILDNFPHSIEAVICKGGLEIIPRDYEEYLFRTRLEAEEKLKEIRLQLAQELIKSNKFITRLFECATSSQKLNKYSEQPIYEVAKELFFNINKC